jgi:FkbM family methyltransferase
MSGGNNIKLTEDVVTALYETLLLRLPDADGLKNKVDAILAGHLGFRDIIKTILRGKEFSRMHTAFYNCYVDREIARFTNDMSQYGEIDLLLRHMINDAATHRVLVDVGARGRERSNSYDFLRFFGWRGLLIEANPALIEGIRRDFAGLNAEILNRAVSNYTGQGVLYIGANDDVSSLNEQNAVGWGDLRGKITVAVERLSEILKAYAIPRDFDLLSLDIEGEDVKVFNELVQPAGYRPRWVIIEASYNFQTRSLDDLPFSPLVKDEYTIVSQTSANLMLKAR